MHRYTIAIGIGSKFFHDGRCELYNLRINIGQDDNLVEVGLTIAADLHTQ